MKLSPDTVTTLLTLPPVFIMGIGWWVRDPFSCAIGAVLLISLYLWSIDARLKGLGAGPTGKV